MANKVAIVTGASGNIGQAVIRAFLTAGYKVIGTIIPDDPVQIAITDTDFETQVVNLLDEKSVLGFIDFVIKKYGRIDAAILTVGGFAMGSVGGTTAMHIHRQYRLNFETAYTIARASFVQMLLQGSGRIFMIGARPGLNSIYSKGLVAYSLTKSLIFRLAEIMNDEAKGTNVVTSVVVPSTIDTPQNRQSMPDTDPSKWVKAADIADIIYFYCTENAAAIREPLIKVYNHA